MYILVKLVDLLKFMSSSLLFKLVDLLKFMSSSLLFKCNLQVTVEWLVQYDTLNFFVKFAMLDERNFQNYFLIAFPLHRYVLPYWTNTISTGVLYMWRTYLNFPCKHQVDLCRICRGITPIHRSPSRPRPSTRPTAALINIHEHLI